MIRMTKYNLSNYKYLHVIFLFMGLLLMSIFNNNYAQAYDRGSFKNFKQGSHHYLHINLMRSWLFMQGEYDIVDNMISIWSRRRLFSDMLNFPSTDNSQSTQPIEGYSYISPLNFESMFGLGEYHFAYYKSVFSEPDNSTLIIFDDYLANDLFNTVAMDSEIRFRNYSMGFIVNAGYYKNKLKFVLTDELDQDNNIVNTNTASLNSTGFVSQVYFYNDIRINNNFYLSGILMGSTSYPRATFFQNLALTDVSKIFGYQLQLAYLRSIELNRDDINIGFIGRIQGLRNYRTNNLNIHEELLEDHIDRQYYVNSTESKRLSVGGTVMFIMNNYFARGRLYLLIHAGIDRLLRDSFDYKTGSDIKVSLGEGIGLKDEPYLNSLSIGMDIGLMTFSNWDLILRSGLYFGHGAIKGFFSLGVKIII